LEGHSTAGFEENVRERNEPDHHQIGDPVAEGGRDGGKKSFKEGDCRRAIGVSRQNPDWVKARGHGLTKKREPVFII